ncbi:hypothetical protein N0V88_005673 [Collariella sp. IMI 366227]|nr:hypothetical protein N0V88_005673 [Collariella sp. IMI 366227]
MATVNPKARFYREFQTSVDNIQQQIDQLPNTSAAGGERLDAVEHILGAISRLSIVVADASDFTPAYDQRTYAETIKSLREQVNTAVASFKAKSRFQFKPRAIINPSSSYTNPTKPDTRRLDLTANVAAGNINTIDGALTLASSPGTTASEENDRLTSLPTFTPTRDYNAEIARPGLIGPRKPSFSAARDIALSDHSRVHIILPASAARATSAGTLTHLNQCVVDMSVPTKAEGGNGGAPFASLALKEIATSVVVAGHVDGPVHVTGLTDKEKAETNMFDQVDDFKWLKATPSPNWSVLPEEEAIPEEVWRKALAGGPGVVIDDTLRSLGVGKAVKESV